MPNLSQPELTMLRENLSAEMLMIKKFATYVDSSTDPQVKNLCQNIQRTHERHRDVLLRYLDLNNTMM